MKDYIFLYGPSGSGKSSSGRILAEALELPFYDLDSEIERRAGQTIPDIFKQEGEAGFRGREKQVLEEAVKHPSAGVIALGGGALLDLECRSTAEQTGTVVVLDTDMKQLVRRLREDPYQRPLLAESLEEKLNLMLQKRQPHYQSFENHLDTSTHTPADTAWQIQVLLGRFHIRQMGRYDIRIYPGSLDDAGKVLSARGLKGPLALVSDSNTGPLYAGIVKSSLERAGYSVHTITIPAGEEHKNITTITSLWEQFLDAGLERGSTAVALGGGVVTDMVGFAAATYLRGIRWVALPTTLLAMVDASLGGKTGIDLPQGKNLAGAFHPPSLVLEDPQVLCTLPVREIRSGLAEALKHGVINDQSLWHDLTHLPNPNEWQAGWPELTSLIRRAVAVKVQIIEEDPYEKGRRAALNLGHTIGHAVEAASDYALSHGECVSIGMVIEAGISEELGLASSGLVDILKTGLERLGLATCVPNNLDLDAILDIMRYDKKKSGGTIKFALPIRIGEVSTGMEVDDQRRRDALISGFTRS